MLIDLSKVKVSGPLAIYAAGVCRPPDTTRLQPKSGSQAHVVAEPP